MNRLDHISGLSLSSLTPADVEYFYRTLNTNSHLAVITERLDGLKRRDWRKRSEGMRLLDILREAIGEISADLHELGSH